MNEKSRFLRAHYSKLWRVEPEDSPNFSRRRAAGIIRQLARKLPADGVYLGVGAGRGILEKDIWNDSLKRLKAVYLVDIADRKPLISRRETRTRTKYANVQNLTSDSHALPLNHDSVDIISSHMAYDFFDDREQAAREMRRVLKPGGAAVIFLHHPSQTPDVLESRHTQKKTNPKIVEFWSKLREHNRLFKTKSDVTKHFEGLGFHVESVAEHIKQDAFDDYWWEVVLRKIRA